MNTLPGVCVCVCVCVLGHVSFRITGSITPRDTRITQEGQGARRDTEQDYHVSQTKALRVPHPVYRV